MKRRPILPLVLLAALILLSGCSQVPKQLEALSAAVQAYDNLYFEIRDASAQLKAQKLSGEIAHGKLEILVPDVAQLNAEDVDCALPELSLGADAGALEEDYLTRFVQEGKKVINSGALPVTAPRTIGITFIKLGDTWSCQLSEADMKTVQTGLEAQLLALGKTVFENSGIREELALADTALRELRNIFGSNYPIEITSLEKVGEGRYLFGFRYADPGILYQILADQAVEAWDEVFYDDRVITVTLDLNDLPDTDQIPMLDGTFTLVTDAAGNVSQTEISVAEDELEATKAFAEEDAAQRIYAAYRVTEQLRPSTKILSGTSFGNRVIIKTSAARGDYFLRFYLLPGTDLNDTGTEYMTCYIRGGDEFTVSLPQNNYRLEYAVGTTWYGSKYIFGPEGSYYLFKSIIDSEDGYFITVTLYGVAGGNTPSETLPYDP
ncbi:MAG: hypothetical protein ACOX17_02935 [Christensenellales bacterium]|jgi:hypothetical protein